MAQQELKTDKLKTKIINGSSQRQSSDRFNVRFLGIIDNISDFISRQVINVTPRTISFENTTQNTKKAQFRDPGRIQTETLSVNFAPDDEGILETIIMMQIMRQKGVTVTEFSEGGNETFDVKIEYYNIKGEVTHYELYKKCFIQSLDKPELTTQTAQGTQMSTTIAYDSVSYSFLDQEFFVN